MGNAKKKKITNEEIKKGINQEQNSEEKVEKTENIENKEQEVVTENEEKQAKEIETENQQLEKQPEIQKTVAMIEVKSRKKRKGSYFAGTIGALLGALVAAIPWIVTYIFTNSMVIPVFASLIPMGAFFGYKNFKGKIGKGVSPIVIISSLIIILLVTAIICPIFIILKSEYTVNLENYLGLFSDVRSEIRTAIIIDLVVGLIFTIIGMILTQKLFIHKMTREQRIQEQIAIHEEKTAKLREQSNIIKNAFLDLDAMTKETAVKKKEVFKQLIAIYNIKRKKAKLYFINCKINKMVKKYKGKYYFAQEEQEERIAKVKKIKKRIISKVKVIITLLILATIIAAVTYYIINKKQVYVISEDGKGIIVEIDKTQEFYGTIEDIANTFGDQFANYYDFILNDKNKKYELYGMNIADDAYEGKDFATIIQEDRDYYAPYLGEDVVSQVEDKQFGDHNLKSYNYTYLGNSGEQYRAVIYLYDTGVSYLWINVYADLDVEITRIDEIIDNLLK